MFPRVAPTLWASALGASPDIGSRQGSEGQSAGLTILYSGYLWTMRSRFKCVIRHRIVEMVRVLVPGEFLCTDIVVRHSCGI
jgi:hypothetical protein